MASVPLKFQKRNLTLTLIVFVTWVCMKSMYSKSVSWYHALFPFIHCTEAHRALELLEDYHSKLTKPGDRPLRNAIERVIRIFKSRLFQALLGMYLRREKLSSFLCNLSDLGINRWGQTLHLYTCWIVDVCMISIFTHCRICSYMYTGSQKLELGSNDW